MSCTIQKANVRITRCQGSFGITDLNAAMKPGKECSLFRFDWGARQFFPPREVNQIIAAAGYDFRKILDDLYAGTWVKGKWDWEPQVLAEARIEANGDDYGQLRILREERPGPRTFSPFVIPNRLTEIPPRSGLFPMSCAPCSTASSKTSIAMGCTPMTTPTTRLRTSRSATFQRAPNTWRAPWKIPPAGTAMAMKSSSIISCHSFDCSKLSPF